MLGGIGWGLVSQSARDNSYVLTTVSLVLPRQIAEMAGADPPFFQKGACKYESSGQTFQGQGNGRGGMGGRVRVRVMSEHVDFFIWISEEFEVIFISGRLPRQLHGDHCTIRESLFSFCLEAPYLLTDRVFSIYVPHFHLGNELCSSQYASYFVIQLWPDKFENFSKGGLQPPQPSPLDPLLHGHRSKSTSFSDKAGSGRRKPELSGLIRSEKHDFFLSPSQGSPWDDPKYVSVPRLLKGRQLTSVAIR